MNLESTPVEDEPVVVGSYRLTKTLGKGTFGKVKLAEHIPTGQLVAVKVLQKELICEQADVERISRQIKILKLIQHENAIQLYEIIEQTQQLFLIMEYAESGDLFQEIVDRERISETDAATYYYEILQGVKYLHSMGITHRDLKPQNILLDNKKIKLADFGLGNFFKDGELLKTACGSPCYAAPEMISKLKYDPRKVDVWSSGIILFAMTCGFLPFEDKNVTVLYGKIKKGEFRIPSHLSQPLKGLLRSILNINPEERFTIDQILAHPWMVTNARQIPAVTYKSLSTNEELLEEVSGLYGFDKERLRRSLDTNKHNAMTTTFYLYAKKERANSSSARQQLQVDNVGQSSKQEKPISENLPRTKTDQQSVSEAKQESVQKSQQQDIKERQKDDSNGSPYPDQKQSQQLPDSPKLATDDNLKQSEDSRTFVTEDSSLKASIEVNEISNVRSVQQEHHLHHSVDAPLPIKQERHQNISSEARILIEDTQRESPSNEVKSIPTLTFPKTTRDSEKTEPRETPKAGRHPVGIQKNFKTKVEEPVNRQSKTLSQLIKPKSEKKFDVSRRQIVHQSKVVKESMEQVPKQIVQQRYPKAQPTNTVPPVEEMPGRLKKNPRMKIENMKKTASKLYERSTSRSTESIRIVSKKPQRKFTWKRVSKKPRLINSALLYVGSIESLKKHLMEMDDRQQITVEFYEMREDVLYVLRSNIESDRLLQYLRTLLHAA